MAKKNEMWVDGEGNHVPVVHIDTNIKKRDAFVNKLVAKAKMMRQLLINFKHTVESDIMSFLEESAKVEGETWVGGTELFNFQANRSVTVKVAKRWTFDEKLQIAKQKIDKVIAARSENSDSLIVGLVNRAFKVDGKGEVDPKQMIGLRQLKVDDDLWNEAMELIADSQMVQSTKTYFYFKEADDTGQMQTIVLEFSKL